MDGGFPHTDRTAFRRTGKVTENRIEGGFAAAAARSDRFSRPTHWVGTAVANYRISMRINAITDTPSTRAAAISMLVAMVPLASG